MSGRRPRWQGEMPTFRVFVVSSCRFLCIYFLFFCIQVFPVPFPESMDEYNIVVIPYISSYLNFVDCARYITCVLTKGSTFCEPIFLFCYAAVSIYALNHFGTSRDAGWIFSELCLSLALVVDIIRKRNAFTVSPLSHF